MTLKDAKARGVRVREDGESCRTCQHFIDHADPNDPDEDDDIQYCGYLVDTLGLQQALEIDEYGGHWTHVDSWCDGYAKGPSLWVKEPPQALDAVDPTVGTQER